jgi:mono/diheme cytochrome c family protein
MLKRVAALAAIVLGVLAPIPAVVSAQQPPAEQHPGARAWGLAQCRFCHGPNGEGGSAPPLAGTTLSPEQFLAQTRNGGPGVMPQIMPRTMTDANAALIHDWLIRQNRPATWTRVAPAVAPNASPGQRMFIEKNCISCHGPIGQVPIFPGRTQVSIDEAAQQIRSPRFFMPTFRRDQISDWEVLEIADFIANVFFGQPGQPRRTRLPNPFAAFGLQPQGNPHAMDLPSHD